MLFKALLICLAVTFSKAEDCSIGNDPIHITPNSIGSDQSVIVISNPEQKFISDATVKEFQVFIEFANRGTYIGIYRPMGLGYLLVGRKFFKPTTTGYHSIPLTPPEYIDVQAGDTLGLQIYEAAAIDTVFGGTCLPAETAHILLFPNEIAEVGDYIPTYDSFICYRPSLKAIADCTSGGLEPHFMIMSRNNHMCFNLHGENDDIYDLVSDPITDIYIRGKTFEIKKENLLNPLSYFSAIGVSVKENHIVFTVNGLTLNEKFYSYNDVTKLEFGEIIIKIKAPNKYILSIKNKMTLVVVVTHNQVAKFLGIYILSRRGLSEQSSGILGQFFNSEFDVNTTNGRFVLDFNDHHKSVNVFKISQLATYSKEPIDCYYYSWLTDQSLLGDKSLYKKNSLTN